jgi:hypothetical protein
MNRNQLYSLHSRCKINAVKSSEKNILPSATDPTQVCSVQKMYHALVNGQPISVPENKMQFNNLKVDDLSSLEKRNTDQFDVFRESRKIGKKFSKVAKISTKEPDKEPKK